MSKKENKMKDAILDDEGMGQETDLNGEENTFENETPEIDFQDALEKEKDRFLRLFAEFENFKKRTSRERIDLFKTANEEVIISMLPILDDFERALKELAGVEDEGHFKGVTLIYNKLVETLRSKGLQKLETKQGDTFDADQHEAITQIPAPSENLKGKIIEVIENGYALGDKIIRYPKVIIGQ